MPQLITFENETFSFPDDVTDAEILSFLNNKQAAWSDVMKAMPGEAKRQFAETAAGGVSAFAKLTGNEELAREAQAARSEISGEREQETPKNMSLLQEGVYSAGPSLALMAPGAVVGAAAAPFAVARLGAAAGGGALLGGVTTGMGIPTGLQKFGETLDYGHSTGRAAVHGLLHGLIEKYTEYLPLREFAKGGWQSLLRGMGHEIVGEELATIGQFINDKISTKPDATLGDLAHDMAVTAISTAVSGPVQAGMVRSTTALMSPFIKPEKLTTEQKATMDTALQVATSDGQAPTTLPVEALGAVQAQPARVVDLADTLMPDKHPAPVEGTQRYYFAYANNTALSEHTVWTTDLEKVQTVVDALGPDSRVAYIDLKPDEVATMQKEEKATEFRAKQGVEPEDVVLPAGFAQKGTYLYGKAPEVTNTETPAEPSATAAATATAATAPAGTPAAATAVPTPTQPEAKPKGKKLSTPDVALILKREGQEKIKLVFENPESKRLYYYAHSLQHTSKFATQEQLAKERTAIAQWLGVPEDQVEEQAKFYFDKVNAVALGLKQKSAQIKGYDQAAFRQEQGRQSLPSEKWRKEGREVGKLGVVSFQPGVNPSPHLKRAHAFLQKWLTMFAPDTKLLVIEDPTANSARYISGGNSGVIVIPNERAWNPIFPFTLAHEFGHHLFDTRMHRSEHAPALAEMMLEWEKAKERVPGMNGHEFSVFWFSQGRHFMRLAIVKQMLQDAGMSVARNDKEATAEAQALLHQPAQALIDLIDKLRHPGYVLSFPEYAAEQFARYVGAKHGMTLSGEVRAFFEDAMDLLKNFFYKVAHKLSPGTKFEQFVDHLRAVPASEEGALEDALNFQATTVYMDIVDQQREWTLKTLERLPKKDKILRLTVLDALKRPDVRQQEKDIFNRVLATFDGDVIDRAQLAARVDKEIVPITSSLTSSYANYGLDRIGYGYTFRRDESVFGTHVEPKTELFRLPIEVEQYNHFNDDKKLFGWARWFDVRDETGEVVTSTRHIVELQSDWAQKVRDTATSESRLAEAAEVLREAEKRLVMHSRLVPRLMTIPQGLSLYDVSLAVVRAERLATLEVDPEHHYKNLSDVYFDPQPPPPEARTYVQQQYQRDIIRNNELLRKWVPTDIRGIVSALNSSYRNQVLGEGWAEPYVYHDGTVSSFTVTPTDPQAVYEYIRRVLDPSMARGFALKRVEAVTRYENAKLVAEAQQRNKAAVQVLPDRWWELFLRKVNAEASAQGVKTLRMATADTVAKVEGWRKRFSFVPNEAQKTALSTLAFTAGELGEVPDERAGVSTEYLNRKNFTLYTVAQDRHDPNDSEFVFRNPEGVEIRVPERGVPEVLNDLLSSDLFQNPFPFKEDYGRNQSIYNRYAKEVTNFVKREFGAREVGGKRKRLVVIGIGQGYEHQLDWVDRALAKHGFSGVQSYQRAGAIEMFDMRTDEKRRDAIDHLKEGDLVVGVHLFFGEVSEQPDYFYNKQNNRLLEAAKNKGIPVILLGDQPDGKKAPVTGRLFGAVEENTWLEWDVKPNLDGVPIVYYDLTQSLDNASKNVAEALEENTKGVLVEVPKWFQRAQGFLQGSLKLSQMARLLPQIQPLQKYRRLMQQMANLKSNVMSIANERIKQWYSLSRKDSLGVMDMLETEVRGELHWTKLEKVEALVSGKPTERWVHAPTEKVAEEAQKRGLSPKAVELFMSLKNDYLLLLGLQEETLLRAIEHIYRNNPIAMTTRKSTTKKVFDALRLRPWVPDRRFGQWVVSVKATEDTTGPDGKAVKKGEKVWFSRHENKEDRDIAFDHAKKMWGQGRFKVAKDYMEDVQYSLRGLPREFVTSLPTELNLTDEQLERYNELTFDLTREGRYLAMFMKKKSRVAGMEQDMRRSYADHMWRSANAVAKMEFGWRLNEQKRALHNLANSVDAAGGDPTPLRRLHEYVQKNYDYVMNPVHEWEQLRAITALWYLWAVPKTALANGTTMITTTYPHLAQKFGDAKATAAIIRAMKDTVAAWKNPSTVDEEVGKVMRQARADGTTAQSFAAETAAVADGDAVEKLLPTYEFLKNSGVKDRARTATWRVLHWGMIPFRVMEEFNRRATLLAAYRLNKEAGLPGIDKSFGEGSAYLVAKDAVDLTQNEYAGWDRAPFLRGKKSVALIFFSFVQNMSFFMFGGDKGWWRGWLMLMALGGLTALPGAQNVIDLLNWLGRKFFDEPVDLRVEAREMATAIGMNPDWVLHGAMHNMFGLGWDASASVSMGRIIPGTDAIFGQGDASRRILQMSGEVFGPFGGLTVNVLQAMMDDNPNGLVRFERAAPTFARNLSRGVRGASEDRWTDARGRTMIDETTGLEVLGQVLGFQPERKSIKGEERHFQSEAAQFYALRRQNLLSSLWQAVESGDSEAIGEVKAKIQTWNSEVPDPQLRITPEELRQSIRSHKRAQRQLEEGVPVQRRYRQLYERIAETYAE